MLFFYDVLYLFYRLVIKAQSVSEVIRRAAGYVTEIDIFISVGKAKAGKCLIERTIASAAYDCIVARKGSGLSKCSGMFSVRSCVHRHVAFSLAQFVDYIEQLGLYSFLSRYRVYNK